MRTIKKIILHCSDTADNLSFGFSDIDEWHGKRGFKDPKSGVHCGYHYIVTKEGEWQIGRPESSQGAHTKGQNFDSLGVCWVGKYTMTKEQAHAFLLLVWQLLIKHGLSPADVFGHCEFNKQKSCPNFPMELFRQQLEMLFKAQISP